MLRSVLASFTVAAAAAAGALLPVAPVEAPTRPAAQSPVTPDPEPLAGKVIVIDPGHQLGNVRFPAETNALVPAGGFLKPCNTGGASTNDGYPEATFTWQVARALRDRLVALGARVVLTRTTNSADRWGPCVDERGRAGNGRADLKVSIHGDGSYGEGRGFHVIAPVNRGATRDTYRPSRRLALAVRAGLRKRGLPYADYIATDRLDGLDFRGDLGTLNLSDMPTVMVELGNMRSAADARLMTSERGRSSYAAGVSVGVRTFLAP